MTTLASLTTTAPHGSIDSDTVCLSTNVDARICNRCKAEIPFSETTSDPNLCLQCYAIVLQKQSLHGKHAFWPQQISKSTPRPKKSHARRAVVPIFDPRSAGIDEAPPKDAWICDRCTAAIPFAETTSVPNLCLQCSYSHERGTVRQAKLRGQLKVSEDRLEEDALWKPHPDVFHDTNIDSDSEHDGDEAYNATDENRLARSLSIHAPLVSNRSITKDG